jgi:hydrogenase maturation protein HypF
MSDSAEQTTDIPEKRIAIQATGIVQGVGFRPFIYNLARSLQLTGWVRNQADAVHIEVQGETNSVGQFVKSLKDGHPPQARIDSLDVSPVDCERPPLVGSASFRIVESSGEASPRPTIPADLATCDQCLAEIRDPAERRRRYPFTNCTNCGPRWSIIEGVPYDRPRTSMKTFELCDDCRREYEDPGDRRFHAQPVACPRCGPRLLLLNADGTREAQADAALSAAIDAVCDGKIVAIKGIGGFQLVCDATSDETVRLLRDRKQRPHKPFAVMMSNLEEVRSRCEVSRREADALASPSAPILLLRRRAEGGADIADRVAPDNPYLGVMLPYSPLHHLLLDEIQRPIICTSGNLAEEPMAISTEEAKQRLGRIADLILTHDRPIVRPVDDSVARITARGFQVMRRARGYAPLPIDLGEDAPTVLAVGGHLKNTIALSLGSDVVLSPHIGDLEHPRSVEVHRRAIEDLLEFFDAAPEVVACDLHPDYASTRQAERLAGKWNVPLVRVQHHHAHVAACVCENLADEPVLGFSFDGTGYGPDETVWGGELLVCEEDNLTRVAHLRTFPLPGGDVAAKEPRRAAAGLLFEMFGEKATGYADKWFSSAEQKTIFAMLEGDVRSPRTSSMGRLFDAVAAICGLPTVTSFEGQSAMALEFAADPAEASAYPLPLTDGVPALLDWQPLIRELLTDRSRGVPVPTVSAKFHNALAEAAAAAVRRFRFERVALTGGCFQNALLQERMRGRLSSLGCKVYTHRSVPPGDGGIALGQVLIAARHFQKERHVPRHSR